MLKVEGSDKVKRTHLGAWKVSLFYETEVHTNSQIWSQERFFLDRLAGIWTFFHFSL